MELNLPDEEATRRLGAELVATLPTLAENSVLVNLSGELGAGKTSLARALLRQLGVKGTVRSPTYTLIEPYQTETGEVHHLDLYRLAGGADLERLGWRELRGQPGLLLVEWPERAAGALGPADLSIALSHVAQGRHCKLEAGSELGSTWLERLAGKT